MCGERQVRRQCPGRGRPDEERCVPRAFHRKAHVNGWVVDFPVAERDFLRREGGADARIVGNDLVAPVEEPLVPYLPEQPPDRLYVGVVEGGVGVGQVHPEAHALGHPLPVVDVELYRLPAPAGELRHADLAFDLGLVEYVEFLLYFMFDRQPVGVPTRLAGTVISLHVLEAGEDVLERARKDMVDAGPAVGGRRPLVPDIQRAAFALFLGRVEYVMLAPQLEYFPFKLCAVITARHVFEPHREPHLSHTPKPQPKKPRQRTLRTVADSSRICSRGEGSTVLRPNVAVPPVFARASRREPQRSRHTIGAMTRPGSGGQPSEPTEMRRIRSVGGSRAIFVGGAPRSFHRPPLAIRPLRPDYSSPSMPCDSRLLPPGGARLRAEGSGDLILTMRKFVSHRMCGGCAAAAMDSSVGLDAAGFQFSC